MDKRCAFVSLILNSEFEFVFLRFENFQSLILSTYIHYIGNFVFWVNFIMVFISLKVSFFLDPLFYVLMFWYWVLKRLEFVLLYNLFLCNFLNLLCWSFRKFARNASHAGLRTLNETWSTNFFFVLIKKFTLMSWERLFKGSS